MNVAEFIAEFRSRTEDIGPQYLWSDSEIVGYLNDALNEACERALLLEDHTSASCCQITLVDGQDSYNLHGSVLQVKRVTYDGCPLDVTSVEAEDDSDTRWEIRTGQPRRFIENRSSIRLVPTPGADQAGDVVKLTVYRRELEPRTFTGDTSGVPEVPERYHHRLLDWMLYRGYSKPDAETIDKVAAADHSDMFDRSFGPRESANVQRKRRDRRPPVVRFQW